VRFYAATKVGPGWLGLPVVFEKNSTPAANLDSAVGGLSYDLHLTKRPQPQSAFCPDPPRLKPQSCMPECTSQERSSRATQGCHGWGSIRAPELTLEAGPEFAPTRPRDLNFVGSSLLRLPIAFNFLEQPSALTFFPVVGVEGGVHVTTHPLMGSSAPEPNDLYRTVVGADASVRFPFLLTHNLFGTKPITIDYSYRTMFLAFAEPYADLTSGEMEAMILQSESLSSWRRSYSRIAFNEPISTYFGVTASLQRGSLPPNFRSVGYTLTLGLTLSNPGAAEH
jgi:hypothetical protein